MLVSSDTVIVASSEDHGARVLPVPMQVHHVSRPTSHEGGSLEEVEPPEDWTGSVDVDPEEDDARGTVGYDKEDDRRQSAGKLEGLDLFE